MYVPDFIDITGLEETLEQKLTRIRVKQQEVVILLNGIADQYEAAFKRMRKIDECGKNLTFEVYRDKKTGKIQRELISAFFCKDMFCPACARRKSLVMVRELNKIGQEVLSQGYGLLHLCLTLVSSFDAAGQLDKLWHSWIALRRRKWFIEKFSGSFTSIEWTFNPEHGFHIHMHVALATKFKMPLSKDDYNELKQKFVSEWYSITGDSYIIGLSGIKNLYQMVKYILKPDSLKEIDSERIWELMQVMKGRKQFSKSGIFRFVKIDNISEQELLSVDNSVDNGGSDDREFLFIERWFWDSRAKEYVKKQYDRTGKEVFYDAVADG